MTVLYTFSFNLIICQLKLKNLPKKKNCGRIEEEFFSPSLLIALLLSTYKTSSTSSRTARRNFFSFHYSTDST